MKQYKKSDTKKTIVKVDKNLDKYQGVRISEEKTAKTNQILLTTKLPDFGK